MFRDFDFWFDIAKVIFFIGLVVILFITFLPFEFEFEKQEIYSIESISVADGRFFLGSGSVSDTPKYYAYMKNEDGSLSLEDFNAESVKLFMDLKESETPYVVYKVAISKSGRSRLYATEIHVPIDTVVRQLDFSFK